MPTLTQLAALPPKPTPWSSHATLQQIDPALGILSLDLQLTGTLDTDLVVLNLEPIAAPFTAADAGTVTLDHADGSAWLSTAPCTSLSAVLPAAATAIGLTAQGSDTASVQYASNPGSAIDAAPLVGTGTAELPLAASAHITATGPGNMQAQFRSWMSADVSLAAQVVRSTPLSVAITIDLPVGPPNAIIVPGGGEQPVTTPIQTALIGDAATGTTSTLSFQPFDPALGQLIHVNITLSADAIGSAIVENLDPAPAFVTIGQTATLQLGTENGAALLATTTSVSTTRALAAGDGSEDFQGPAATSIVTPPLASSALATAGSNLPAWEGAAPITLTAQRTGQTAIAGPGNMDLQTTLQAGGQATISYTYLPGDVRVADGANDNAASSAYAGPVAFLQHQYIWSGTANATLLATAPNTFLKGGAGDDALAVTSGSNVLDGGAGSNFLTGGTGADGGHDTFFVDARGTAATWSTISNFHQGDMATIFGFNAGISTDTTVASDGVAGYTGFTIHAATAGAGVNASMTFAGVDQATAAAHFVTSTGTLPGNIGYLLIQYS